MQPLPFWNFGRMEHVTATWKDIEIGYLQMQPCFRYNLYVQILRKRNTFDFSELVENTVC